MSTFSVAAMGRGDDITHWGIDAVKTEVKCLQITEVRCPLFTGYRVQSSRMKRLWEYGHLAVRDVQGPQDRHFHSAVGCSC